MKAWAFELEPPSVRRCANRCEFCFIEGLLGAAQEFYIRDDDYRLSFAYGNFAATLSNMKERDEQRIIEYRLATLRLSPRDAWDARRVLLNNSGPEHRRAADAPRGSRHSVSTARW